MELGQKGIKKVASNKSGMKIEACYDQYLWIGFDGARNPLVLDKEDQLIRLSKAIQRILDKKKPKRSMSRTKAERATEPNQTPPKGSTP